MSKVLISNDGQKVIVVPTGEEQKYITASDREMDRRATLAVKEAINKAVACGKPVAKFNFVSKQAYLEYPDGKIEYVGPNSFGTLI